MSDVALWWVALGVGLVVALVVVALLETFLRQVHRIERGVGAIWQAGKQVAANTATTWQLQQTSQVLDALTDEAMRHEAMLKRASDGSGSS